jgi:hypothetical protein
LTAIKKLFANGKFVCEYEAPANQKEEIELCQRLLSEHGLDVETTEEQAIFRQAAAFSSIAASLYARDLTNVPRNGMSVVPFVVNAVFALELYLKTFAKLHSLSLRGHDLLNLFDSLPAAAIESLRSEIAMAAIHSRWKCGISEIADFRNSLQAMRNAFSEWRYLHEKDPSSGIQFPQLIFAMEVFHSLCQKHPEINSRQQA